MTTIPSQPVLGFIGTGVMGASMAGHLLAAGHVLHVHSRTRAKAEDLISQGAVWAEDPAALAAICDVVFTMVGFPTDVEQLYDGPAGLIAQARPGTVLVDMTTSRPDLAQRLAADGARRGIEVVDAPVSGGDKGAREAALSIMVGGSQATFAALLPLLRLMGRTIVHQGPAGSGQHCKMCNQMVVAANMIGVCESLAYARRAGLDPATVLQSISSGAAGSWALSNLAPRILAEDFAPGFYVKHFIKDMAIAAASADDLGLDTPGLDLALELYRQVAAAGDDHRGTQALFRLYG